MVLTGTNLSCSKILQVTLNATISCEPWQLYLAPVTLHLKPLLLNRYFLSTSNWYLTSKGSLNTLLQCMWVKIVIMVLKYVNFTCSSSHDQTSDISIFFSPQKGQYLSCHIWISFIACESHDDKPSSCIWCPVCCIWSSQNSSIG